MRPYIESTPLRFERTYLSRSVSRLYDGPVGDPYGGPAYGQREMPAVAIAAAVYGGAALAGIGMVAVTGWAAVAAVGAVIAGVGVIVGSPELTKIGGVIGLAGGIGSLGTSAGWWGDLKAGTTLTSATPAADAMTSAAQTSATQAIIDAPTAAAPVVDTVAELGGAPVAELGGAPTQLNDAGTAFGDKYALVSPNKTGIMGVPDVGKTSVDLMSFKDYKSPLTPELSAWDKLGALSKWADNNKVVTEGLFKGLSGFAEPFTDKYKADVANKDAMTGLYKERAASEAATRASEAATRENSNYAGPSLTRQFAASSGISLSPTGPRPIYTAPLLGVMAPR